MQVRLTKQSVAGNPGDVIEVSRRRGAVLCNAGLAKRHLPDYQPMSDSRKVELEEAIANRERDQEKAETGD